MKQHREEEKSGLSLVYKKKGKEESTVPTGDLFKPIQRSQRDVSGMGAETWAKISDKVRNCLDSTHASFSAFQWLGDC